MGKRHKKRDDNQRHRNREDAAKESEAIVDENDQVYTVEILKIIKEAQQIHGLRHEDYRRYRTYCSNKVHRLRHLLKLVQGDKRHYRKKNVTIAHLARKDANPKLLQIPLFLAERAWAYAMEIRSETGDNSRKRFHMIRRLKKAAFYAGALDELCRTQYCDAQTELESTSYLGFIQGVLNFELQNWEKAAENFKKSHIIYEKLASTITDVANRIYKKQADDINHSLRFCYYNLDADGHDIDIFQFQGDGILGNLDLLLQQTKKRRTEELRDLVWYDLSISVRPEKVRTFLFAIQSLDKSLATVDKVQEKIKLLDQILVDCRAVITIASDDMKINKHSNEALITYLTFIRLTRTVQRNTLMMEQADKEKNVTRWYDIIVELIDELAKLPQVNDNDQYKQNIRKIAHFKPIRFVSLGKVYEKKRDYPEALKMYENALNEANSLLLDAVDDEKLTKLIDDLEEHKARVKDILEELEDQHTSYKDVEPVDEADQFLDAVDDAEVTIPDVPIPKSSEKMSKKTKKTATASDKSNGDEVPVVIKEIEVADNDDGGTTTSETTEVNPGGLKGLVKGLWSWGSQKK